jgi:hypothetical protein
MNKDTKGNHIEPNEDSLYKVKSAAARIEGSSPSSATILERSILW